MPIAISVASSSSAVVSGSQVRWTLLVVNLDAVAAVGGSLSLPVPPGCRASERTGRGGGLGATGVTAVATVGWVADSSVLIPAGGSVWYEVTDTVNVGTLGTITATAVFTPQAGAPVSASGSVASALVPVPYSIVTSAPSCGFCEPVEVGVKAGTWQPLPSGQEAVMWAVITPGATEMRNARIVVWANTNDLPLPIGSQDAYDRWIRRAAVAEIRIPWLPADSRLVLDGRIKSMTLECGTSVVPAEPYVLVDDPVFDWPVLTCDPHVVAFIYDAYNTPSTAATTIDFISRFRL